MSQVLTPFTIHVDVAEAQRRDPAYRRVAGLLADNETVAVATMTAGGTIATPEIFFTLNEVLELSEAALSGDQRALTTPGLARKLSATVAVLFRVAKAAGALQTIENLEAGADDYGDDPGHSGDQPEAGGDEDPGG